MHLFQNPVIKVPSMVVASVGSILYLLVGKNLKRLNLHFKVASEQPHLITLMGKRSSLCRTSELIQTLFSLENHCNSQYKEVRTEESKKYQCSVHSVVQPLKLIKSCKIDSVNPILQTWKQILIEIKKMNKVKQLDSKIYIFSIFLCCFSDVMNP